MPAPTQSGRGNVYQRRQNGKSQRGELNHHEFPWRNEFNQEIDGRTAHANIQGDADGFERTAPVGSFPSGASEFGVHDMAGNAMEWVSDWYDAGYYQQSPVKNPQGPDFGLFGRVLRGGSWRDTTNDVHSAKRRFLLVNLADETMGFRCALDVAPTQGNTPWNLNNDGTVNIFNLVIVGSNFGTQNPTVGGT